MTRGYNKVKEFVLYLSSLVIFALIAHHNDVTLQYLIAGGMYMCECVCVCVCVCVCQFAISEIFAL